MEKKCDNCGKEVKRKSDILCDSCYKKHFSKFINERSLKEDFKKWLKQQ